MCTLLLKLKLKPKRCILIQSTARDRDTRDTEYVPRVPSLQPNHTLQAKV